MIRRPLAATLLTSLLVLTSCALAPHDDQGERAAAQPDDGRRADLRDLIERFSDDSRSIDRFYGVAWSEQRLARQRMFLEAARAGLSGVSWDSLAQDGRVDFILLRNHIDHELAMLDLERRQLDEMLAILPGRDAIHGLELARRRMEDPDPSAAAAMLSAIPEQVKSVRTRIESARSAAPSADCIQVSPVLARRASGAVDSVVQALDDWNSHYDGFKPEFSWWVREPYRACRESLAEYSRFLREDVAGLHGKPDDPLIGDPIGREALLADLRAEHVAYTPEELLVIADEQFAWCEREYRRAAADLGLGDDWKAALARVKDDHSPPGDQDRFVRDEALAAIAFLKEKDLITIPPLCEETWRLEMHSPEAQRTLPFAVYGGQYMGVSYAAQAMSHDDKLMSMRGNNRHFTHIVTPHELIPGHHLQGFIAARERAYRQLFRTPFLVEGWCLYWEMRLWELNWAGRTGHNEAMDRIGMLFWRSHRCARIIVSLKFHLGEMTPQEMIDFLVERVGHERLGATAEVRRFIGGQYSPLYQAAYMIGGLQVMDLKRELVDGGRMTDRQFHDAVLLHNSIPIELIRAGMTGEPLSPDGAASWRFRTSSDQQ